MSRVGDSRKAAAAAQRGYYEATAADYDRLHVEKDDSHFLALNVMLSFFEDLDIRTVLDVGSGTGRAPLEIKRRLPHVRVIGVEPVKELREIGVRKGLAPTEIVDGDAQDLKYGDGDFDLVCEFGALHHIPDPRRAVLEMLRVARKAIFISDSNNFGQGSRASRTVKQLINHVGLWPVADFVKTRGKGYRVSDSDGISYSYSVFNQYPEIRKACAKVHMMNLENSGPDLYRSASSVAVLGIKGSGSER